MRRLRCSDACELLTNWGGAARVGFERANVCGRRWRRTADDVVEHPRAAQHGRCTRAVGGDFQNAGLRQDAASDTFGRQRNTAHRDAGNRREAVEFSEAVVEVRKIGVDELEDTAVILEQISKEESRFRRQMTCAGGRRFWSRIPSHSIQEQFLVWHGGVEVAEVQPLIEKIFDEGLRARRCEQAFRFAAQDFGDGAIRLYRRRRAGHHRALSAIENRIGARASA